MLSSVIAVGAGGIWSAGDWAARQSAPLAVSSLSIAVLPFVNMSSDTEQEFFSDGITEEMLNLLAKIPELRVTSRSSVFSFKGQTIDIPTIAKKLGVAHVLEGSVRKNGENLRITAQLVDTADGFHLWSETYDHDTSDVFGVQTDIAEKIATALDVVLDDDEMLRVTGMLGDYGRSVR